MHYFKDCQTKDDVKRLYREWAKKLHPDAGGRAEDMVELQSQYETWKEPSPFRQYSQSNSSDDLKEALRNAQEEFYRTYAGYGGYRYRTVNDMKGEYFTQRNDPRLADYEQMKLMVKNLKSTLSIIQDKLSATLEENAKLKKKLFRLKKKLEKPSKVKKDGENSQPICL